MQSRIICLGLVLSARMGYRGMGWREAIRFSKRGKEWLKGELFRKKEGMQQEYIQVGMPRRRASAMMLP